MGPGHFLGDDVEGNTTNIGLALDDAVTALATLDPRKGQIVELHFFGGLTVEETAQTLGVSVATIGRELRFAKAWLSRELQRTSAA